MELLLDKINIILIIAILINLFLGVIVFFNGPKRKINVIYSFNIVAIVSWLAAMFFYRSALPENNIFWCTVLYITPTLIASSFLYFTYIFPSQKDENVPLKAIIIFFINLIIVLMVVWPGFIIKEVNVRPDMEKEIIFTKFYIFYFLYTLCFFSFGFTRLFQRYCKSAGIERLQILYLLIGYAIAANLAFVTNLIMPWIGFFFLNWLGQIFTVIMVTFASYAITRYNLMDIKVVATEFFSGLLIVASLVPIFEAKSNLELAIRIIILIITISFAVLLIHSVNLEIRRREKMEQLALKLKKTSDELAKANEGLKQLDNAKSEFISIASHQLRTPLSAVKGFISMILDGDFGPLSEKIKDSLAKVYISNERLIRLVDDLLDITRIESGKQKFKFAKVHLEELVSPIIEQLKTVAKLKKLKLVFHQPKKPTPLVNIDADKLHEVMMNFIDNAVKYTKAGKVEVFVKAESNDLVTFRVKDTGMGIAPDVKPFLFQKFSRGEGSFRVHTEGLGLGLYVAKMMIDAHKGKIWAESEGPNKGSSFCFSLPVGK